MGTCDWYKIGNRLLAQRKALGLTQAEVAERAGLSDRTYADIERGSVNMRVETALRICRALGITPNDVLLEEDAALAAREEALLRELAQCSPREKRTVLGLLSTYLRSLGGATEPDA